LDSPDQIVDEGGSGLEVVRRAFVSEWMTSWVGRPVKGDECWWGGFDLTKIDHSIVDHLLTSVSVLTVAEF
jgi:hypothetical protein